MLFLAFWALCTALNIFCHFCQNKCAKNDMINLQKVTKIPLCYQIMPLQGLGWNHRAFYDFIPRYYLADGDIQLWYLVTFRQVDPATPIPILRSLFILLVKHSYFCSFVVYVQLLLDNIVRTYVGSRENQKMRAIPLALRNQVDSKTPLLTNPFRNSRDSCQLSRSKPLLVVTFLGGVLTVFIVIFQGELTLKPIQLQFAFEGCQPYPITACGYHWSDRFSLIFSYVFEISEQVCFVSRLFRLPWRQRDQGMRWTDPLHTQDFLPWTTEEKWFL